MPESQNMINARKIIDEAKNGETLIPKAIQLASLMLDESLRIQAPAERKRQEELARMLRDPKGKTFTILMTDQCFRSDHARRVANQLVYLIHKYGIPSYLSTSKRIGLAAVKWLGKLAPFLFVPLVKKMLRQATAPLILPGEPKAMLEHVTQRSQHGIKINLNHLGEAILGEEEAQKRLQIYLNDLAHPQINYVSVKISTICSQINLIGWEETLSILAERLKVLYRAAMNATPPKFINLDMEEYRDLHITVELFQRVLDDPEFHRFSAGIVLQSYLPDSFALQKRLTEWAMARMKAEGAPIKIRIVKGANLAMEKVDGAVHQWPQAPYEKKSETDANFKRMLVYGCDHLHAPSVHIGVASHNLFDIAYGLLLRSQHHTEKYVSFEMLEGMADHMRQVVQTLSGGILLYCPVATRAEFQNAVAYLIRRLDENTAEENFLRHTFQITLDSDEWKKQAELFAQACENAEHVSKEPRRTQDRHQSTPITSLASNFENEPDTDWSLLQNRQWIEEAIAAWHKKTIGQIPLVIDGEQILTEKYVTGQDPSQPGNEPYRYSLAKEKHVEEALNIATTSFGKRSPEERAHLLLNIAQHLRENRAQLIVAMMADTGKIVHEADSEVSEAIDFAEYYARNLLEIMTLKDLQWSPRGVILVAPPWNFPCSIPAGGILAALAGDNAVLFKPAPESVLVGWELAKIFWEAGVSKQELQFITGEDETIGSMLVKDSRVSAIVLTGATSTAKMMLQMRPSATLYAETGGKNSIILSSLCDRDLAIKDIIQSAFGHSGQKCSACSLAILDAELYDDPAFRQHLKDAAASLSTGSPWQLATKINPLIREPNEALERGLMTLNEGEEWLLKPQQDDWNPLLWSPGIKLGVKPGSFMHQTELFGPVLGLMRASNLKHAIQLANDTPYGLTTGLHSLDEREHRYWMDNIEAGNCYINRGITGAIVQRQPFGGCKDSSFGPGAKAGGPNYLMQLMIPRQEPLSNKNEIWNASVQSYTFFWENYFTQENDVSGVLGQKNVLIYRPHAYQVLRVQEGDAVLDIMRFMAAAEICHAKVEVSSAKAIDGISSIVESDAEFIERLSHMKIPRVRFVSSPSEELLGRLAGISCRYNVAEVMANGRVELLHYLREISLSADLHRYGSIV